MVSKSGAGTDELVTTNGDISSLFPSKNAIRFGIVVTISQRSSAVTRSGTYRTAKYIRMDSATSSLCGKSRA